MTMMNDLQVITVQQATGAEWIACMAIYRSTFPTWEREPEGLIEKRLNAGQYQLMAGVVDLKVVGFYLLDLNLKLGYVSLSFLAVKDDQQGQGFGACLCRDAMARFKRLLGLSWLFVEAEDRQAMFYARLGFLSLRLNYQVPCFDGPKSMPMHLMVLPIGDTPVSILKNDAIKIIRHMFIRGYMLADDDPRIAAQLACIDEPVQLIS